MAAGPGCPYRLQWPAGGHCAYFRQAWASQPGVGGPRHCPFSVSKIKPCFGVRRPSRHETRLDFIMPAVAAGQLNATVGLCVGHRSYRIFRSTVAWPVCAGIIEALCRRCRCGPAAIAIRPLRLMWLAIRSPVSVAAAGIGLACRGPGHAVRLKPPALREWRPWRPWGAAALAQSITP